MLLVGMTGFGYFTCTEFFSVLPVSRTESINLHNLFTINLLYQILQIVSFS